MCYIEGGRPEGSTTVEIGCRDKAAPLKDEFLEIHYPLYFAGHSGRWNAAPAFLGLTPKNEEKTLARMYLITKEQFMDVAAQENDLNELVIDFNMVKHRKKLRVCKRKYGTLLHVGEKEGYDIFTFTCENDINNVEFEKPSVDYLAMILKGILSNPILTKEKAIEYLFDKHGVKEFYTMQNLKQKL